MAYARIKHSFHLIPPFLKLLMANVDDTSSDRLARNHHLREELHTHAILSKKWSARDLKARREFWYKQMYFLVGFIKKIDPAFEFTKDNLIQKLDHLILDQSALDKMIVRIQKDHEDFQKPLQPKEKTWVQSVDEFLCSWLPHNSKLRKDLEALSEDNHDEEKGIPEEKFSKTAKDVLLLNDDVIKVMMRQAQQGFTSVIGNAANSNRHGSSEYSQGSLEEALCRVTSDVLNAICHFRDVNHPDRPNTAMVSEFQRRYLRAHFRIMKNILQSFQPDRYINSTQFLEDFLTETGMQSREHKASPIHFDMQNRVYEVPPEKGEFSFPLFCPKPLSTFGDFSQSASDPTNDKPIVMIHAAAPDLRTFEGLPDKMCAKDAVLRHPEDYGALRKMIIAGIRTQCNQARNAAERKQNPSVIFMLPGCGAFGNPVHNAVEIFLDAIQKQKNELDELHIPFCIVEKNPKTFAVMNNYLNPPKKIKYNCKFVLACCTSFLIFPLIYVYKFQQEKKLNERYHAHSFFHLKLSYDETSSTRNENKFSLT